MSRRRQQKLFSVEILVFFMENNVQPSSKINVVNKLKESAVFKTYRQTTPAFALMLNWLVASD